ncbi:uncharacterized protein EDB91DRAFT_759946 [Suillus paluster]|uniref:uncharacterized protein n=1 Tax=Suillus paluster TaxID=48578 RepID=UPI001B88507F|nr:uncharacterized protein EDB91DRAFT_759946 [Suillus paluster]KAG1749702.1 hypothetical protein EDB91DRAFT_759946 [Suillus paluster]
MLKRQRPPTPPPSLDEIPSLTPCPDRPIRPLPHREPLDLSSHESRAKRRRIHPPVLDGAQRGWGKPHVSSTPVVDDSDGEEDWIDGEDDAAAAHAHPHFVTSTDYKRTNTILQEVHALHQHRLMFSQPNSQSSPHLHLPSHPGFSEPPSSMATHPHQFLQSTHGLCYPSFSSNGKLSIPALPECPLPEFYSHLAHAAPASTESAAHNPLDFHEVKCVRERYEDTNKLLGSLFLSRRRELQDGNFSTPLIAEEGRSDHRNLP